MRYIAPLAEQYRWGYGISNLMQLEAVKEEYESMFNTGEELV